MRDPIKIMPLADKSVLRELDSNSLWEVFCRYTDYLEGIAKNTHLSARLSAEMVGGSVPDIGAWKDGE